MESTCHKHNKHQQSSGNKENRIGGFRMFLLMMLLVGQLAGSPAQTPDRVALTYKNQLVRVFEYRDSLEGVHPFVKGLYPIAIGKDNQLFVFDLDETKSYYHLVAHEEIEMKVPKGTRAAFPLAFYDNRCACVVTGEVFDTPEGYVTIFHEFVHCHQWHTVEQDLRARLPLAQKSMEAGDFMWEINYPFPYEEKWFVKTYGNYLKAARKGDRKKVEELRKEMAEILKDEDYQYMLWQEWKEGFALYLENKMRKHLNLPENQVGRKKPYNRTTFYAGGEALINILVHDHPELDTDLKELFHRMYNF